MLSRSAELIVADMGCGEAKIAQNVKQKVYSFDLVAQNSSTVACDMSQVCFMRIFIIFYVYINCVSNFIFSKKLNAEHILDGLCFLQHFSKYTVTVKSGEARSGELVMHLFVNAIYAALVPV